MDILTNETEKNGREVVSERYLEIVIIFSFCLQGMNGIGKTSIYCTFPITLWAISEGRHKSSTMKSSIATVSKGGW